MPCAVFREVKPYELVYLHRSSVKGVGTSVLLAIHSRKGPYDLNR